MTISDISGTIMQLHPRALSKSHTSTSQNVDKVSDHFFQTFSQKVNDLNDF